MAKIFLFAAALMTSAPLLAYSSAADTGKSADPLDKVVCKRFLETGSMVKGYRTCKTKREWQSQRDAARKVLEKLTSESPPSLGN